MLLQGSTNILQQTAPASQLQPAGGIPVARSTVPQTPPVAAPTTVSPAIPQLTAQEQLRNEAYLISTGGMSAQQAAQQAARMGAQAQLKSEAQRSADLSLQKQNKLAQMQETLTKQEQGAAQRAARRARETATTTSAASTADAQTATDFLDQYEGQLGEFVSPFGENGLTPAEQAYFDQAGQLSGQRESSEMADIRRQVEEELIQARQNQARTVGATQTTLAKIGALGTTSAGAQYLDDLDIRYQGEIGKINAAGQQAIQNARMARDERDFKTLGVQIEAIRANRQELALAEGRRLDNIIKYQGIIDHEKDTAEGTLDSLIQSGLSADQLPEGYLDSFDKLLGVPEGSTALRYDALGDIYKATKQGDLVDAVKKVSDYLNTVPMGQRVDVGDQTYFGTDAGQIEIDKTTGDVYSLRKDTSSPTGFTTVKVGNVGAQTNRGIIELYNPRTGTMEYWSVDPNNPSDARPVTLFGSGGGASTGGVDSFALAQEYPADESFSFNEDGSPRSWCVEWLREISQDGSLPQAGSLDTIDQKAAFADDTIGFGEGQRMPAAGDFIITNEDSQNGHMALITQIREDPTGNLVAVLAESNYQKGTVTYNRTIPLSDTNLAEQGGRIIGFRKAELKPQFSSQPTSGAASKKPEEVIGELGQDYGLEYMRGAALGTIPEQYRDAAIDYATGLRSKYQDRAEIKAFKKIATAISGLGQRKMLEGDLYEALEQGDDNLVREVLKESVYQSAGQDTRGKIDGRIQTSAQLLSIRDMFDDYEKRGFDTGVFKGAENKVLSNIGRMSDPTARRIANSIAITLIEFRKNYTGVAFSPQESAQYERILPSIGNLPEVNRVVIDSLVDTFSLSNETFYRARLGEDYYDSVFPQELTLEDFLNNEGL